MYQQLNGEYYTSDQFTNQTLEGLDLSFLASPVLSIFGGNKAKKEAEREMEALRLQQQIAQENNAAALETERLRLQAAQIQSNNPNGGGEQAAGMSNGLKTTLIVSALGLAALGTFLVVKAKNGEEKSLNGLIHSLE